MVLGGFAASAAVWNLLTPIFEGSDEPDHIRLIVIALTQHRLVVLPSPLLEAHQPPLYYILGALLLALTHLPPPPHPISPGHGLALFQHPETCWSCGGVLTIHVLRFMSAALTTAALVPVALTLRLLFDWPRALAGTAVVAFIPQFGFYAGLVNNDGLAVLVGSALTYLAVRQATAGGGRGWWLATGIVLGLGFWTKEYVFAWIPFVVAGLALAPLPARAKAQGALVVLAVALLVASPIFIRNLHFYGAAWPFAAERANIARVFPASIRPRTLFDPVLWTKLPVAVWQSFWYAGGWTQLLLPAWVYWLVFVVVAPIALASLTVLSRGLAVCWIALVASYAGLVYSNLTIQQFPGRYLFPVLPGLAAILVGGIGVVVPRRAWPAAYAVAPALMVTFSVLVMTLVAARAY